MIEDVQEHQCDNFFPSAFSLKLGKFLWKIPFMKKKKKNREVSLILPLLLSAIQNDQTNAPQEEVHYNDAAREAYPK